MRQRSIPFMLIRGGSSKGIYLHAQDLPTDAVARENLLLDLVGRDVRQIDGLGGAHPLTSKVAIVDSSQSDGVDIDYLFAQVVVGENRVDTTPNCGNILAGVGAFAIESGLIEANTDRTSIMVNMLNTNKHVELILETPKGQINYDGTTAIDGVPGTSAPIYCNYMALEGAVCGALFPTGNRIDVVNDIRVTCIDNGMPVVLMLASDLGIAGDESPEQLNENSELKRQLDSIRTQLGPKMNLGDVSAKAVPKMCLISPAKHAGLIHTRTFIPHHCHNAIGVLGAVSVATACIIENTIASKIVNPNQDYSALSVEHPSGEFTVALEVDNQQLETPTVKKAGVLRTARLLAKGEAFY